MDWYLSLTRVITHAKDHKERTGPIAVICMWRRKTDRILIEYFDVVAHLVSKWNGNYPTKKKS